MDDDLRELLGFNWKSNFKFLKLLTSVVHCLSCNDLKNLALYAGETQGLISVERKALREESESEDKWRIMDSLCQTGMLNMS